MSDNGPAGQRQDDLDELIESISPGYTSDWLKDGWFRRHHADDPVIPVRAQCCDDCAVEGGLYTAFSAALSRCSPETQKWVSERWRCHEGGGACRGNYNFLLRHQNASSGTALPAPQEK